MNSVLLHLQQEMFFSFFPVISIIIYICFSLSILRYSLLTPLTGYSTFIFKKTNMSSITIVAPSSKVELETALSLHTSFGHH